MDKRKAAEMIERQRRRWPQEKSDLAIALRAQNHYFVLALMDVLIGAAATLILPTLISRVLFSAVFLIVGILFFMSSWRFHQIRKLLADSDTKSDSSRV
jgi:hypothetical protein